MRTDPSQAVHPRSQRVSSLRSLYSLMIPGIVYGVVIGKYKNDKDVWADISQGFAEMGNYVFMCFFIAIFTNFFSVSKLGTVLAIKGANLLSTIGFSGIPPASGLIFLPVSSTSLLICFCKMGDPCTGIYSDDDVDGLRSGDHTGRLSNRRFHHKPAVSVIYIPSGHSGLCPQA